MGKVWSIWTPWVYIHNIYSWYNMQLQATLEYSIEHVFLKLIDVQLDDFRIQAWKKHDMPESCFAQIWTVCGNFPSPFLSKITWAGIWAMIKSNHAQETVRNGSKGSTWSKILSIFSSPSSDYTELTCISTVNKARPTERFTPQGQLEAFQMWRDLRWADKGRVLLI